MPGTHRRESIGTNRSLARRIFHVGPRHRLKRGLDAAVVNEEPMFRARTKINAAYGTCGHVRSLSIDRGSRKRTDRG